MVRGPGGQNRDAQFGNRGQPGYGGPQKPEYEPKTVDEKLAYLIEEMSEVTKAACKALRWGLDSCHPGTGESNAEQILNEWEDVKAAIERLMPVLKCHTN